MTSPTDWRAQRYAAYAATKSVAWQAGYAAHLNQLTPFPPEPPYADPDAYFNFLDGWWRADDDYDEARDRAREDRQHYPASPLSAFERNRF